MNRTTWNTTFERADVAKIPTKKILIVFAVWNNETRKFSYDYTVKEFEIYDKETNLKKLCENVVAFKEGYINGKIGKELYKFELNNFYEIEHFELFCTNEQIIKALFNTKTEVKPNEH